MNSDAFDVRILGMQKRVKRKCLQGLGCFFRVQSRAGIQIQRKTNRTIGKQNKNTHVCALRTYKLG